MYHHPLGAYLKTLGILIYFPGQVERLWPQARHLHLQISCSLSPKRLVTCPGDNSVAEQPRTRALGTLKPGVSGTCCSEGRAGHAHAGWRQIEHHGPKWCSPAAAESHGVDTGSFCVNSTFPNLWLPWPPAQLDRTSLGGARAPESSPSLRRPGQLPTKAAPPSASASCFR